MAEGTAVWLGHVCLAQNSQGSHVRQSGALLINRSRIQRNEIPAKSNIKPVPRTPGMYK